MKVHISDCGKVKWQIALTHQQRRQMQTTKKMEIEMICNVAFSKMTIGSKRQCEFSSWNLINGTHWSLDEILKIISLTIPSDYRTSLGETRKGDKETNRKKTVFYCHAKIITKSATICTKTEWK